MIYCVSDIHGDLDKLERMMELIRFSDADHLYIIGDVIDRGVMGVDILRWIMAAPNMTMLLGNHEQMCLDTLGPKNEFGARDLWRQNGGMPTYRELLYHRMPTERGSILRFLAAGSSGSRGRPTEVSSCSRLPVRGSERPHLGSRDSRQQESLSRYHLHCGAHTDMLSNGKNG